MYNQLTREQRYAIYLGLQDGKSKTAIARQINCDPSTVYREIKRNSNKRGYYVWKEAQELAMVRRERSVANHKIAQHILKRALQLLVDEDWSPRQISGYLKREGVNISHERIYRAIRSDESGELRKHCRHKMKYLHHVHKPRVAAGKTLIPDRVPIQDRPVEADGKRFGDWEMDLVVGKGQRSAVLTIIERSTSIFMQTRLNSKRADEVEKAVVRLLLPYKDHILTITTDNGIEFRNHQKIAKKLNTTVYFTDPYCSWQKGAIENMNKLFRQYFPKGTDFNLVTQKELDQIQYKINRRPREKLNFSNPKTEFYKNFV